ncbi:MAG: tRNA (adenosine(37)-N6)-dimethylallyltransferase MiaA [Stappiaceae bacterium]
MQQDSLNEQDALFALHTVLIAGPTASGKSALALEVANRLDGIVINVDSMQVYRELRVLSARPSADEEAQVPHRLYGHISARDPYSVALWLADVREVVADCIDKQKTPILVGGTGLYFKALLEGLSPVPKIDEEVRAYWRERAANSTSETLHGELATRDRQMAIRLEPNDMQRIVRSLEVFESTGKSLAEWQGHKAMPMLNASTAMRITLSPPRPWLHQRINDRFEQMVDMGGMEEAVALSEMELKGDSLALRAIGAEALVAVANGTLELAEALERSKAQTRQYAKRQETWFRNQMPNWLTYDPTSGQWEKLMESIENSCK